MAAADPRPPAGEALPPSQRRLQRPADFTGPRLERFRDVLLRHGVPGALLALTALAIPDTRDLLASGLAPLAARPLCYATGTLLLFAALAGYRWLLDRRIDTASAAWILYLLGVSIAEECVFRVAIPYTAAEGVGLRGAVIASNAAFALLHYFSLRWKWRWCIAAFFAGMALSRLYHAHADLALIVAAHWIGTFINTPREPRGPR